MQTGQLAAEFVPWSGIYPTAARKMLHPSRASPREVMHPSTALREQDPHYARARSMCPHFVTRGEKVY